MPDYTNTAGDDKITIGFKFVDQLGNRYSSESSVEVFYDGGESEIDTIGRLLDVFLKQCGYYRGGDCILMESLTEDELDAVSSFLDEYRAEHAGAEENDS